MGKNNKISSIKITKKAKDILDKYEQTKSQEDIYEEESIYTKFNRGCPEVNE